MEKSKSINLKSPIEIGILEIRRHPPILYTFSKICKTKNTNVTIFTTKEILSRVETHLKDTENYNIILKKDHESYISYLKRVEKFCNQKSCRLTAQTYRLDTRIGSLLKISQCRLAPGNSMELSGQTAAVKQRFSICWPNT